MADPIADWLDGLDSTALTRVHKVPYHLAPGAVNASISLLVDRPVQLVDVSAQADIASGLAGRGDGRSWHCQSGGEGACYHQVTKSHVPLLGFSANRLVLRSKYYRLAGGKPREPAEGSPKVRLASSSPTLAERKTPARWRTPPVRCQWVRSVAGAAAIITGARAWERNPLAQANQRFSLRRNLYAPKNVIRIEMSAEDQAGGFTRVAVYRNQSRRNDDIGRPLLGDSFT